MRKVQFTETVLRDANQSLIATRLPYSKFEPILETMDKAGFYSAEVWGGATFDVCLRYLREDPWERLRKIRAKMPNTKLQMLLRGQNILGYKHYPDDVVRKFVEYSVKNGIDIIRIFDALNDVRNLEVAIDETNKQGAHASGTICFTTSPVHTLEKNVQMVKDLQAETADRGEALKAKLADLHDLIEDANQGGTMDEETLNQARDMYTQAKFYMEWGTFGNGSAYVKVVHNPEEIQSLQQRADVVLDEAIALFA